MLFDGGLCQRSVLLRTFPSAVWCWKFTFVPTAITKGLLSLTGKSLGEIGSSIEGRSYWFSPLAGATKKMDRFVWVCASEDHSVFSERCERFKNTDHDVCGVYELWEEPADRDECVRLSPCVSFAVGVNEISVKQFQRWHAQALSITSLVFPS